ncbi:MAG: hypothetical protein EOM24_31905, partial [Chloroflexia bacterium]|nr:hypothetical protein [Chloroflexia bacterium]
GEQNNCNDPTRNGTPYRITNRPRSTIEFIQLPNFDQVAPTGGYDEPANGTAFRSQITLRGRASDALSGVDHVDFTAHYDGSWHVIAADNTAPYEYTWDAAGLADQEIILGFDIYDRAGNVAYSPEGTRTIIKDATLPTGGYDAPAHQAFIGKEVQLAGHASDNLSGVAYVNFTAHYNGSWHVIGTDHEPPYAMTWNTAGIADQAIILGFDIYDRAGNVALAPEGTRTVTKDTTPPTAILNSPVHQSATSNPVFLLEAEASDALSGVATVSFHAYYDGAWHELGRVAELPYTFTWDASALADQRIVFSLHATDRAGNTLMLPAQRVREVILDREAPVVTATLAHAQPTADHTRLPIHLTTTDLSGAHEVRVSLDGVTWEAWQPLASPFWWQTEQAHGTTIHPF